MSPSSIFVTWSALPLEEQNGIVQFYIINVTEQNTGRKFQRTSSQTEFLLQNLHPYYVYELTVSAFTIGTGPDSAPVRNTTHPAGQCAFQCM